MNIGMGAFKLGNMRVRVVDGTTVIARGIVWRKLDWHEDYRAILHDKAMAMPVDPGCTVQDGSTRTLFICDPLDEEFVYYQVIDL